jgi:predicted transcriptional regulator
MIYWLKHIVLFATMEAPMGSTTMGVKLDDETRVRLQKLGELKQRSPHWLMQEAIHRYLDAEERYEREKAEDLARWQRYLTTGTALPQADVKTRLAALIRQAEQKAQTP